jgi:hypothetical protein
MAETYDVLIVVGGSCGWPFLSLSFLSFTTIWWRKKTLQEGWGSRRMFRGSG